MLLAGWIARLLHQRPVRLTAGVDGPGLGWLAGTGHALPRSGDDAVVVADRRLDRGRCRPRWRAQRAGVSRASRRHGCAAANAGWRREQSSRALVTERPDA